MAGRTDGLFKNFRAGAAIAARRIVKFGGADDTVIPGAAATDALIGVSSELAAESGERCDVALSGIAEVVYGGNVVRGAQLTSDAAGKAIAAAPAQGANVRIIGTAMASGVDGDIGVVHLVPSALQGA